MVRLRWRHHPRVLSRFVDGDTRSREAGIGKGANRDAVEILHPLKLVVDGRTALRAEVKLDSRSLVADPDKLSGGAGDSHMFAKKPGLLAKDAAGPALASQAMADGDAYRLTGNLRGKLTTAA